MCHRADRARHDDAFVVGVRLPIVLTDAVVAPRTVHGDEPLCWRCGIKGHDLSTALASVSQPDIMKDFAQPKAFEARRHSELANGPSVGVSVQRQRRLGLRWPNSDGANVLTFQLGDEALAISLPFFRHTIAPRFPIQSIPTSVQNYTNFV